MTDAAFTYTIPVYDLLTVIVALEHCEFDLTQVTYWSCWRKVMMAQPVRRVSCFSCLLKDVRRIGPSDGRSALIDYIKDGTVHVEHIGPMPENWRCPSCVAGVSPPRVPKPWNKI